MLNGQRTWMSAYTQHMNTLEIFEGVASQTRRDRPSALTLDGVRLIAPEHRRVEPRAQVPCHIELGVDEGHRVTARTIDLSRSGCRVELPEPDTLAVGEMAVAELTLTDALVVRTRCEVLRLDESRREAVLRFRDLTDTDATAIRRSVLTQLSSQGNNPVTAGAGQPSPRRTSTRWLWPCARLVGGFGGGQWRPPDRLSPALLVVTGRGCGLVTLRQLCCSGWLVSGCSVVLAFSARR